MNMSGGTWGILIAIIVGTLFVPYIVKYPVASAVAVVMGVVIVSFVWVVAARWRKDDKSGSSRT